MIGLCVTASAAILANERRGTPRWPGTGADDRFRFGCTAKITERYVIAVPRLYHVSSVRNRESIKRFGLDWTRMGAAPGIAGSRRPEVEGVFLCVEQLDADWFVRLNNTGGPVDIWAVEGVELNELRTSPEGFSYFPGNIGVHELQLIEQDSDETSSGGHAPASRPRRRRRS